MAKIQLQLILTYWTVT